MALVSGLFKSNNGDRKYKADFFAAYFASFIGNGVFPNPSTGLQVMQHSGMQTTVKPGKGWINGYFVINDSDHILQHDLADGVLKRIDRIVMRLDFLERLMTIEIKKGVSSSSPIAPTLTRNNDYYELALADVLIENGATAISQADITDLRLNNNLCGIVHGVVNQVDTTTIFNNYQTWFYEMTDEKLDEYNDWFAQHQQEFEDWFVTIQDILDENVAGNLLTLIQQNQDDIRSLIKHKTNVTIAVSGWTLNGDYYEYEISDSDISVNSIVDINIQLNSLNNAKMLLSACNSSNGAVTLYASSIPDSNLVVDYRITNEVI